MRSIIIIIFLLHLILCYNNKYIGILKTCSGWRLNHLPEIKEFIRTLSDEYPIEVVFPGGDPRLTIMNHGGEEIEEISLVNMNKIDIERLLNQKGFYKFNQ